MKYVTVNPMIRSLWDDLDSLTDNLLGRPAQGFLPKVDVTESADRYVLEADLPGYSDKDIELKVKDGLLTLSSLKSVETNVTEGKDAEEKAPEAPRYLLRERVQSSFSRSFKLPKDVDGDRIEAVCRNGVLTLTLFKRPEPQAKSITIRSE